jgi:phosphatidylserine decarboxylase
VRVAKEGLPFVAIAVALVLAAAYFAPRWGGAAAWLLVAALFVIAGWVLWFFRDPERAGDRGERLVVAPADGKVVLMNEVDEPGFMRGRAMRISIFMNVFSVHVNRYPVSGTVQHVEYRRGKFLNAAHESSSEQNEQMSVGIEANGARVMMRQIAGLIARRIITYTKQGDVVHQGERMGLIRFGSRVDVFVPLGSVVKVKLGDLTVAGVTVIAELPHA